MSILPAKGFAMLFQKRKILPRISALVLLSQQRDKHKLERDKSYCCSYHSLNLKTQLESRSKAIASTFLAAQY
jgi:hypothetical protein